MNNKTTPLLFAISLVFILAVTSGCTGVMVGGAATGVAVAHDRRSAGTVIDDQGTSWKITEAIFRDKELSNPSHINVTVYNGSVLLSGETPTEDLKIRANATAARVAGTEQPIYNELLIASPSTLGSRTNDAYITTKVKAAFLNIEGLEDFDVTRVKVTTESGVVYLMGLLYASEANAVTESARTVNGVKKVVKLFEYIK